MNQEQAKSFSQKNILKGTTIILGVLVLLLLLQISSGNPSKGASLFLEGLLNIHTFFLLLILFGTSYFFARKAGVEIIIEKQNILIVSLKYVILISLFITAYTLLIFAIRENDFTLSGLTENLSKNFLPMFLKTDISLLIVWLWAARKMKSIKS